MRALLLRSAVVIGLLSTCMAQFPPFPPCRFTDTSTVEHKESIAIHRISITESSGVFAATAFIPDGDGELPGALFSHSSIHGGETDANLASFAWALAKAGAAAIVIDGTIQWQSPINESVPDPHMLACAGRWLVIHARLVPVRSERWRAVFVGTLGRWGGGNTPFCREGQPCFRSSCILGLGTVGPAEWTNTDRILTSRGQLDLARWVQTHLNLNEIKPEWLAAISQQPGSQ
jgi:hypothetical protein